MRKPGLEQLLEAALDPTKALVGLGPRRAVIQCRHHSGRATLAEVRDGVVVANGLRHDLRSSYDIWVQCWRCPPETGEWVLDLVKVGVALAQPHHGVLKLDVEAVSRAPRDRE